MKRKMELFRKCRKINIIFNLPTEIILEIFSFLSVRDIKTISLVCKHWLELTQHQSLEKRLKLRITKGATNFPLNRTIYNVVLDGINESFKFPFGNKIEYLELKSCTFCENDLLIILSNLTFLKGLSMNNCLIKKQQTKPHKIFSDGLLENMKELTLSKNRVPMCDLLTMLLCVIPSIVRLDMFVTNEIEYTGPNAQLLMKHIKFLSPKLKHLTMNFLYDLNFIKQLSAVSDLQLSTLYIGAGVKEIEIFLLTQVSLTSLIIKCMFVPLQCNELFNEFYKKIFNNLLNLTTCILPTEGITGGNEGIKYLCKLQKLEVLELSVASILKENLLIGILQEKFESLKKLKLQFLECNILPEIAVSYKNLTELKIHITTEVTNNDFQIMWKNLQNLRLFKIYVLCGEKITDYALSGIPETKNEQIGYSIAELKYLRTVIIKINSKQISSKIFVEISKLKELFELKIRNMIIDSVKDIWVLKECTALQNLQLYEMFNIEEKHIKRIRKEFSKLNYVHISLPHCVSSW